jgi:hypothetical protein
MRRSHLVLGVLVLSLVILATLVSGRNALSSAGGTERLRQSDDDCGPVVVERANGATVMLTRMSEQCQALPATAAAPAPSAALPPIPTLITPTNGAVLNTIIPVLGVDAVISGTAISPQIQWSADPSFTHNWYSVTACGWEHQRYFLEETWDNFTPGTIYYLRTRSAYGDACSSAVQWTDWSTTWSFTTGSGGVSLSPPTLIYPANGATVALRPYSADVEVGWQPVLGQLGWQIKYQEVGGTSWSGSMHWIGADSSAYAYTPLQGHTYDWWIKVRNGYAWSAESAHWRYTVAAGPTPTPTATPLPNLDVNPASLTFLVGPGAPAITQTLAIANTGGGVLIWTAAASAGWLRITPGAGVASPGYPGQLLVGIDKNGVATYGIFTASITVSSSTEGVTGSPRLVPVRLSNQSSLRQIALPVILKERAGMLSGNR